MTWLHNWQPNYIRFRTTICEAFVFMLRTKRERKLICRSADAAHVQLAVACVFPAFSKYLVLDKMCSLCKPGYITLFPVPTTTKVNFVLSAGQLEGEEFVSWFNNNNWTHGRCSFLRSIRCACSHTHTFPLHVLHKCPCADRECNSMGWLWSTQKKTQEKEAGNEHKDDDQILPVIIQD